MNDMGFEQNNGKEDEVITFSQKRHRRLFDGKKKLIFIAASVFCILLLLSLLVFFLGESNEDGTERETFPQLSLSQLYETKEEGFDIMEYDKYLSRNRTVMFYDVQSGVTLSIDDTTYKNYGEGVALMYEMICAVIAGDSDTYNSMLGQSMAHHESFTQQQLYDIRISKESQTVIEDKNGNYSEYVFTLEYKIQENNGTFKDNLLSDTSRPHTVIINDSDGELLIMDIIDVPKNTAK